MKESVYMISSLNTLDEIKAIERAIDENGFTEEFVIEFYDISSFAQQCYDLNDFDSLVLANVNVVKRLIVMGERIGFRATYKNVTMDVFDGKIGVEKLPVCFKQKLNEFYYINYSIDSILDKILLKGGIQALNKYDYMVLNSL